jgi:outer membrane receptor protein involved in Fe transport
MLSLSRNRHMLKLGGRVRGLTQSDRSTQNYNGTFTFTSLDAYRTTELGLRDGLTPGQIHALGGGASQFSMISGDPLARVGQVDAGVFAQDDWRILPQLTLTAGLRYEVQNNIGTGATLRRGLGSPGRREVGAGSNRALLSAAVSACSTIVRAQILHWRLAGWMACTSSSI